MAVCASVAVALRSRVVWGASALHRDWCGCRWFVTLVAAPACRETHWSSLLQRAVVPGEGAEVSGDGRGYSRRRLLEFDHFFVAISWPAASSSLLDGMTSLRVGGAGGNSLAGRRCAFRGEAPIEEVKTRSQSHCE